MNIKSLLFRLKDTGISRHTTTTIKDIKLDAHDCIIALQSQNNILQDRIEQLEREVEGYKALCLRENAVLAKAIERKSWAMVWVVKDSLGKQALGHE